MKRQEHGVWAYRNNRCRCEVCKAAHRERMQADRARRLAEGVTHGTRCGYDSGCRCEECKAVRRAIYKREREAS